MATLIAMLPIYLLGNLHCIGMCGPLVMMLGRHRYRNFYFLGRTLSITLVATISGFLGALMHHSLFPYSLASLTSFFFGSILILSGLSYLFRISFNFPSTLFAPLANISKKLSLIMLQDRPSSTFLFGLSTVLLPCGQTLIVFSACALSGSGWTGMINGFAFALLTTPSLLFSMQAHHILKNVRHYYEQAVGVCACTVGILAFCRGFAEMGWINHLVLSSSWHIVLY